MSRMLTRDTEDTLVDLAGELEQLAQQPRLARGDYEAQAMGALCRAAAVILRSLRDSDVRGEPPGGVREE